MLIECPDCKSEVSDAAPACPKCGRPMTASRQATHPPLPKPAPAKGNGCGVWAALVFAVVVGWIVVFSSGSDHESPRPKPASSDDKITPELIMGAWGQPTDSGRVGKFLILNYRKKGVRLWFASADGEDHQLYRGEDIVTNKELAPDELLKRLRSGGRE